MASEIAQATWRLRKKQGALTLPCSECGRKRRSDSTHPTLCKTCWRKTPEGRAYVAAKVAETRNSSLLPPGEKS